MASNSTTAGRLSFAGKITLRAIDDAHARLRSALAAGGAVTVDCAELTETDVSFVQLLLSAHASAGDQLSVAVPLGPVLQQVLRRGGFVTDGHPVHPLWQSEAGA